MSRLVPEIVLLGGLGEFGANLTVYRLGRDCVIVDAGMRFPGPEHPGVDRIVPDFSALDSLGTLHGAIVTHGHDDHVGALPALLERFELPVYAPDHALGLARAAIAERPAALGRGALRPLPAAGETLALGPFSIQALAAAHSIPQSKMIVLRTPAGAILHTADYKLESSPGAADRTDLEGLAALGREGVLALVGDSTNADRPGTTPPESCAIEALAERVRAARERVLVTCFASHVERVLGLAAAASSSGRKLALVGTSLLAQTELAERLGLLRIAPGVRVGAAEAMGLRRDRVLIVASGSQAEPGSAFARIAARTHRDIELAPGDTVIHSARAIPGNEQAIGRAINRLCEAEVEVLTASDAPVHVSGHGSRDELARVLELVRPRYVVPVHGEHRQLRAHAALANATGFPAGRSVHARTGDVVALGPNAAEIVDRVPAPRVFLASDGRPIDPARVRERVRMAADGVLVAVVALGAEDSTPQVRVVRGGWTGANGNPGPSDPLTRAVREAIASAPPAERGDPGLLEARIAAGVGRHVRRTAERRPLVLPIVIESPSS